MIHAKLAKTNDEFSRKSGFVIFLQLEHAILLQKNPEETKGRKYENFDMTARQTYRRTNGAKYIGAMGASKEDQSKGSVWR